MPSTFQELQNRVEMLERRLAKYEKSDRFVFEKDIMFMPGRTIRTDTTTGLTIGATASQQLGFFGVTPVAQQTAVTIPSITGTATDGSARQAISDIVTRLKNLGLFA